MYDLDHDLNSIRRHQRQKSDFYDFFQKAVDNYIDGDWVNSQANLMSAKMIIPFDGPLCWLSEFMEQRKNLPPEEWKGVRDLDLKQSVPEMENAGKIGAPADQDANPEPVSPDNTVSSPRTISIN